jgi:hypothetical protein
MVSDILCDCEAWAVLRFSHLGCHILKPADFADVSVSKVLHFIQSAGLLNSYMKVCTKGWKLLRCKGHCHACPKVLCSALTFTFTCTGYLKQAMQYLSPRTLISEKNYDMGI